VAYFGNSKVLTAENLTRDPKIEGLNPAVGTTREKKMEKVWAVIAGAECLLLRIYLTYYKSLVACTTNMFAIIN